MRQENENSSTVQRRILTRVAIERLQPREKDYRVFDTSLPGFHVKVCPTGRKVFVLDYRLPGASSAKKIRYTIGPVGSVYLRDAKREAQEVLSEVRRGGDPAASRRQRAGAVTLAEFTAHGRPELVSGPKADRRYADLREDSGQPNPYGRWLRERAIPNLRPRSVDEYCEKLRLHILPTLGQRRLDEIQRSDVEALKFRLSEKKTTANRAIEYLSAILGCAAEWELVAFRKNPCSGIRRFSLDPRRRHLHDWEIERLAGAIFAFRSKPDRHTHRAALDLIEVALFTACRRDELRQLRWNQVDLDRGLLTLPLTKTGVSQRPISASACKLLKRLRPSDRAPGDFVFSSRTQSGLPIGRETVRNHWQRILKHAGLKNADDPKQTPRIHDLRHTNAAQLAAVGGSLGQIGKLLGHNSPKTTERYVNYVLADQHRLADTAGDRMAELFESGERAVREERSRGSERPESE